MEKDVDTSTDIVIVGGGLVGVVLAKALSTLNFKITLVERQFLSQSSDASLVIDTRALALNLGTLTIVKRLLNIDLSSLGTLVKHIYVSDQKGFGRINLNAVDENLPFFGCVIPILKLTQELQQLVLNDPKITCIASECVALEQNEQSAFVALSNGQRLAAKLIIGADGAHSKIRSLLNIEVEVKDYQQTALIGNVHMQGIAVNTAYERFTSQGPLALLPFDGKHMTLVWIMPSHLATMRQSLPHELILQDLQQVMGYRAGLFKALGQMHAYPLTQVVAKKVYAGRVGLLGNAAHSLHPIAAQGFNLSMRDIFGFYQALVRYQDSLATPDLIWQAYVKSRGHDQARTVALTNTLLQTFTQKNPMIRWLRDSLMLNLEGCPPAKTLLNEIMVGLT